MPGEYLTLDIKANDEASPTLKRVASSADEAARSIAGLGAAGSKELASLAKLTSAQARLATAQAKQAQLANASQRESIALARAQTSLAAAEARTATATARSNAAAAQVVTAQARAQTALTGAARAATNAAAAQTRLETAQRRTVNSAGAGVRGVSQFSQSISRSVSALAPFATTLTGSLGSLGAFGPVGLAVGAALGGVAVAAGVAKKALDLQVSALKSAIITALDFEQAIARVGAVSNASVFELEKLRQAALAGGASTLFTARESAEALRFLAQAGLDVDQATQALPQTLALAAAGSLDLAKAADITTNILTGYSLQVGELARVNDILVTAANTSNTNITELGVAFSYTAGVASATKQEFEDITAILAVLANNGIKGSKSGRAVANAISRIQKPTAAGAKVLRDLNISLVNADGSTKSLSETLREFERRGAQTSQVLQFFGEVAGRSLITVLNNGTAAVDRYSIRFRNAAGAAAEFQRVLQDTASAQVKIFQSTIETLSIAIGERFTSNIKASAEALTRQAAQLLKNEQFLRAFDEVADDATKVLAQLLRIVGQSIPLFVDLGAGVLKVGANIRGVIKGYLGLLSVFNPVIRGLVLFNLAVIKLTSLLGDANEELSNTEIIGKALGDAFVNAAKDIEGVNTFGNQVTKTFKLANAGLKVFGQALNGFAGADIFGRQANEAARLQQQLVRLKSSAIALQTDLEDGARRILGFDRTEVISEEVAELRARAQFELNLAQERDARTRIQIQLEEDIRLERAKATDTIAEDLKVRALQAEAARKIAELEKKDAKRRTRSRREDTGLLLEQARLSTLLAQTDDQRERIALQLQQKIVQINAAKASQAVKDAQTNLAQVEAQRELRDLEIQIAAQRRASGIEALSQQAELLRLRVSAREQEAQIVGLLTNEQRARRAILDEADQFAAIEAERRAAIQQISGEELPEELRILKLRAVESKAELERQTLQAQAAQKRAANEERFTSARIAALEQTGRVEDRIAAIRLKAGQDIAKISREDIDARTRALEVANAQRAAEAEILAIRQEQAVQRLTAIGDGVSAGLRTDVSPIFEQAQRERDAVASAQIAELERAKTTAQANGANTALLERRIELLREEAAAEARALELQRERIESLSEVGAGLAQVATQAAIVAKLGFDNEAAYTAMGAAISATAGIAGALASGLGLSAKQGAKLQAAVNAAAAIAAGAAYAASGFTAVNLLGAAIQHGVAAAKFAAIAGTSASVPSIPRGGSTGSSSPVAPAARGAEDRVRASRANLEASSGLVINVDFGSSTQLSRAPDVAREIMQATDSARGASYRPGARRRNAR